MPRGQQKSRTALHVRRDWSSDLARAVDGSHNAPPCQASLQVKDGVDRTYHDANHNMLFAGDPLPVHLRRSRAVKAAK